MNLAIAADLVEMAKLSPIERITLRLGEFLIREWNKHTREAIKDAIRVIAAGSGSITDQEVADMLEALGGKLGINLRAALEPDVAKRILQVYEIEQKAIIGSGVSFDLVDEGALRWLNENTMYWVGNYYDRELSEDIARIAGEVISEGLDRAAAGKRFATEFREKFGRSDAYWEGLSNHVTTRSRNFGAAEAYTKAGIEFLKLVASKPRFAPPKSSLICTILDGTIFPVKSMVKVRDDLMAASTPEKAKKVAPWIPTGDVVKRVGGKKAGKLPKYLTMPPFHFRCQTWTVAATADEAEGWRDQEIPSEFTEE